MVSLASIAIARNCKNNCSGHSENGNQKFIQPNRGYAVPLNTPHNPRHQFEPANTPPVEPLKDAAPNSQTAGLTNSQFGPPNPDGYVEPFHYSLVSAFEGVPVPERHWLVPDWIVVSHWKHYASVLRWFAVVHPPYPPIGVPPPLGWGGRPFGVLFPW